MLFLSLQEKCIKSPVEGLSYDDTVRLISSLMSFSYNDELESRQAINYIARPALKTQKERTTRGLNDKQVVYNTK